MILDERYEGQDESEDYVN